MRSNSKLILAALMGVLVLSAIGSASASAAFNKEWAVESGSLPHAIAGSDSGNLIWTTGELPTVTCKTASLTGTLEAGGASKNTVSYSACTSNNESCRLHEPLVLNRKGQLIEVNGTLEEKYTGSEEHEQLGIFQWESISPKICASAGRYKIKGSEKCQLPEIGVFKLEHSVECPSSGDSLTWGEKTMEFEVKESISGQAVRYKAD